MTLKNDVKVVKTICNMCLNRCGIDVYMENGQIVKVAPMQEHPYNTLCVKAYAIPELVHSRGRLTNPLRKVDGEFNGVSRDEANANILTDDEARDPVSGYPGFRSVMCRIVKAKECIM